MVFHPNGIMVKIIGIELSSQHMYCIEHDFCCVYLEMDPVARFRKVQINIEGKEELAIAVYKFSDGIDTCCVGFLRSHLIKYWKKYDGLLAQVIKIYSE